MTQEKIQFINSDIDNATDGKWEVWARNNRGGYQNNKTGLDTDSGLLVFENNKLIDYDGMLEIPAEVIEIVKFMGFEIDL